MKIMKMLKALSTLTAVAALATPAIAAEPDKKPPQKFHYEQNIDNHQVAYPIT